MPTEIELDLPDHFWKSRAERAEAQNRELVTEIAIRDGVISDLQDRPVAPEGYAVVPLEPTPAMLAAVADVPTIAASVWRDMVEAALSAD